MPTLLQNHFLAALSEEARSRLSPDLELVSLPLGVAVRHVYFPTDAVISLLYVMEQGSTAEIAMVGNDGLVGITLYLGGELTPSRAIVQNAGSAYRLPRAKLKDEFKRHGELLMLMLRYARCLTAQMDQTAVCNRYHNLEQRLGRWLLLSLDRLPTTTITMTRESIANLLGVDGEVVNQVAGKLQMLGVLQYSRSGITVLDRPKLELLSCECYATVKTEADRLFPCAKFERAQVDRRTIMPIPSAA
jgi:CRP-like cAMP-binding protein